MKQKIIIAGGSGFLGRTLAAYFKDAEVVILTRHPNQTCPQGREVYWDGCTLGHWAKELESADALINLAGVSVDCRYTEKNRRLVMDSRIDSTRVLGEAMAGCPQAPRVWLNSSTATIYKHTYGAAWDEHGEIGAKPEAKDAFSIEVATAWERVFNEAKVPGTRKVALRTAMVMGHGRNSVFPVMLRMIRFGLGGQMGDGRQYMSWIHEVDFCRAIEWLIAREDVSGVVNLAAPNPVTNA
ncbi:MAG: epimerase, partial [Verrucomicrobiota bacterium]